MIKIKKIKINKKTLLILAAAVIVVAGCVMASYWFIHQHNIKKALSNFNDFQWEVPSALLNANNLSLENLAPSDLARNTWQPQITVDANILPESDFLVPTPEVSLKTPDVKWAPNQVICQQFQGYASCDKAPTAMFDVCQGCLKKK